MVINTSKKYIIVTLNNSKQRIDVKNKKKNHPKEITYQDNEYNKSIQA